MSNSVADRIMAKVVALIQSVDDGVQQDVTTDQAIWTTAEEARTLVRIGKASIIDGTTTDNYAEEASIRVPHMTAVRITEPTVARVYTPTYAARETFDSDAFADNLRKWGRGVQTPPAVTGLKAQRRNNTSITLSWPRQHSAVITSFSYQQKGAGSYGNWTAMAGSTGATTSWVVTGLTDNQAYSFRIRPESPASFPSASNEASATP